MKRIVAKFGGTSLESGDLIRKGAISVRNEFERKTQVAVVVSAMGETTDSLIKFAKSSTDGKISSKELDSIMAIGEETSAKIFAASLESLGLEAQAIRPRDPNWPIVTDSIFGSATPLEKETRKLIKKNMLPLLEEGVTPVICGFLGEDQDGNVTTLGRGGSDITAFLLGRYLNASDVTIVTDVEGIMSADPRWVKDTPILERITAGELCDLARYGAKIVHYRALSYKEPQMKAKIIHHRHGSLRADGTFIEGSLQGRGKMAVKIHPDPLAMLTVVGEEMQEEHGILVKALGPLSESEINVFGVSIGPRSFSVYVTEKHLKRALDAIHEPIKEDKVMKSMSSERNIAMLVTESEKFIDTPGIVARLSDSLAKAGINIIEIYSSKASISFFVNWEDRKRALELLKRGMGEMSI